MRRSSRAGMAASSRSGRGPTSKPWSRRTAFRSPGSPGSTPRGGSVTPGLVDPHTHLLFGGSREGELVLRQQGAAYLDILAAGGGILSTVAATRAATAEELLAHGRRWLDEMLAHGVTTIEAKSGYGLDLETEIRLLDTAFRLGAEGPIDIVPTFLGAHAVAPEYRARPDGTEAYVRSVIEEQLPGIAAHGRARFCDVFCEDGVFSADQSRRILTAAAGYGMGVRLHADELAPSGGAELAVELGAASADHLATPSDAGIDALAAAAETDAPVVATLLPVTTWFLMKDHHAPARTFIERGVPVAIGTDFNPGTSPTASLPLAMTAACVGLRMTPGRGPERGHHQCRPGAGAGRRDRVARARQGRGPHGLARPDHGPDPRTGRPRTWSAPSSSAGGSSWTVADPGPAPRSDLLAARLEQDRRSVSAGRLEKLHRQLGLRRRLRAHLVEELGERLGAVGLVLAQRHRDHDARIELGDERRGPGRAERAAERHARDVDRADVAELLLGQEMADVAEVDGVQRRRARRRRRPACRPPRPWRRRGRSGRRSGGPP